MMQRKSSRYGNRKGKMLTEVLEMKASQKFLMTKDQKGLCMFAKSSRKRTIIMPVRFCAVTFKVRRGGHEEIPLIQGKEQQLCFAGAAVKRYPTSKVRETQVRW